jgi:membrane-associated phospholipid phosphatase
MPFIVVAYIGLFALGFIVLNVRLSVEWVSIALVGAAVLTGRLRAFFRDWGVFVAAVIAWQVTDGLALKFNVPWRAQDMITADKWLAQPFLHGQLPTIWLQQHLFHNGKLSWYDILAVVVYSLHFLLPLGAGFVLWLANRELFHNYATCFIVAAIVGFATYIIYPAIPPWYAAQFAQHCVGNLACYKLAGNPHPYVPWVWNVWGHTMKLWVNSSQGNFGFGPLTFGYDQIGAMPSEHVMYPTLVFLFFRKQFGRIGYLMIPYIFLVMFSIVYMGQHYVVDGIVGAAYAVAVYTGIMIVGPKISQRFKGSKASKVLSFRPMLIPASAPDELAAFETAEGAS